MGEFEEKFNAILGDPQAMGQIMALARSLGGGQDGEGEQEGAAEPPASMPDLGGLDPRLLQLGSRLMAEYQRGDDSKAALLTALRPFLRPERQGTLDRAIQAAKLSRLIRVGLAELGKEGAGDV